MSTYTINYEDARRRLVESVNAIAELDTPEHRMDFDQRVLEFADAARGVRLTSAQGRAALATYEKGMRDLTEATGR